jgi:hypothetical protein
MHKYPRLPVPLLTDRVLLFQGDFAKVDTRGRYSAGLADLQSAAIALHQWPRSGRSDVGERPQPGPAPDWTANSSARRPRRDRLSARDVAGYVSARCR